MKNKNKRAPKLKTFTASYAYDVPHYVDFSVKATSEAQALKLIRAANKAGKFDDCEGTPDDSQHAHRVFVMGRLKRDEEPPVLSFEELNKA